MKLKGKMEEMDGTSERNNAIVDRSKYKKLEMPMFLGENPESWVYRAEHFFEINSLLETEKVKVAMISLGQDEVDWYRWSQNRRKIESWEDLKAEVIGQHPQTLEECMKEAQLVNDRNLALKLAKAELGIGTEE
ncbi:retrotransposon protein [Cucumis melo var. makuwa]|uniref:Retrotransposon protein n=1 Tax=Cucumis melo var. makuwa TaxID=1194695 RepID=A0A5D3D001_CUCMM|nr:retrotransposon protein [Cucumis melo var. makuwa]TYK17132.1 retrotransposon protein [Cucumis melo var. makuwa]